jgi:hypothetical protein
VQVKNGEVICAPHFRKLASTERYRAGYARNRRSSLH